MIKIKERLISYKVFKIVSEKRYFILFKQTYKLF